jgi:hypothetical protein
MGGVVVYLLLFGVPAVLAGFFSHQFAATQLLFLGAVLVAFNTVIYIVLFVRGGNSEVWGWFWFLVFPILAVATLAGAGFGRILAVRRNGAS